LQTAITPNGGGNSPEQLKQQLSELWQIVGGTKLANRIASALSAQTIHAIERIKVERLYAAAGHDTFEDFLDHDPQSPMRYDTYRRRARLLEDEGDVVFDLLNSLAIPFEPRKLLASEIKVDGNQITIGDTSARLDDNVRIVELITTLHKKNQEQARTIDRGKKDVDKHKRRADEAEKRVININPEGTDSGKALLTAAGALSLLRETLAEASDEERAALREPVLELLRNNHLDLSAALGVITSADAKRGRSDLNGLSDEDVSDLMED
jgi:hypothetical protein